MLEVCIDSVDSAVNAIHGGADELELCSHLDVGGLTPGQDLVTEVCKMVNNVAKRKPIYESCSNCNCKNLVKVPKVNVMIRCHSKSFTYVSEDLEKMLEEIEFMKKFNIDRFVFGALINGEVDKETCSRVIAKASPLPVTFHRAFDLCKDADNAIKTIISLGFTRILTSGLRDSVNEIEAVHEIKRLASQYGDKIEIMPGGGVTLGNVRTFIDMGCKIVHGSFKVLKKLVVLPNVDDCTECEEEILIYVTNEDAVKKVKERISL